MAASDEAAVRHPGLPRTRCCNFSLSLSVARSLALSLCVFRLPFSLSLADSFLCVFVYLSGALFLCVGVLILSEQSSLRSYGPVEYSTLPTCQQALQNSPCVRTQYNISYGGEVRLSGSGAVAGAVAGALSLLLSP